MAVARLHETTVAFGFVAEPTSQQSIMLGGMRISSYSPRGF